MILTFLYPPISEPAGAWENPEVFLGSEAIYYGRKTLKKDELMFFITFSTFFAVITLVSHRQYFSRTTFITLLNLPNARSVGIGKIRKKFSDDYESILINLSNDQVLVNNLALVDLSMGKRCKCFVLRHWVYCVTPFPIKFNILKLFEIGSASV